MQKHLGKKSIRRGAVICIRVEEVRKGLNTSTLKFNRCKKKRIAVLTHCIKIAVLIWNKYLILIQMHPNCITGAFGFVWCNSTLALATYRLINFY